MTDISDKSSYNRPDRSGMKTVVAFVDHELSVQIKVAAAETVSNVQKIAATALEEWLATNGTKRTALLAPNTTQRKGLKTVVAFVDPEIARQIKIAAAYNRTNVQTIAENALIDWIAAYSAEPGKEDMASAVREIIHNRTTTSASATQPSSTSRAGESLKQVM